MLFYIAFIALIAALSLTFENAAPASAHLSSGRNYDIENSYVVKLKDGVNATSHINSLPFLFSVEDANSPITHWWPEGFKGYSGTFVGAALDAIVASPDVEYVEKSDIFSTFASQTNAPWNLQAISTRRPVGGGNVKAMTYTYNYNLPIGDGVDIYIVDSGVYIDHNEFEGRATFGWAARGLKQRDGHGHGTHVAGIAAGKTYGVAKRANIIAVKVLDDAGHGNGPDIIEGINWILANVKSTRKLSVVCMAFGNTAQHQGVNDAVRNLIQNDIAVFAAAGNESKDTSDLSPASVRGVIVVGSVDITNRISPTSNFGPKVDVFAPGVRITSASNTGPSRTKQKSGTSMATAHVVGIAANFLSIDTWMTPADIGWMIWHISTKDVISGLPAGTLNCFAFNGASP